MGAKLTLDGTSTGAVKAVTDLHKAMDNVEKGTALTAAQMKKLEQAAQNVVKNNEQPLEKYTRRLSDLATMVDKGKLSLVDAEKAAQKYGVQLEKSGNQGASALEKVASKITDVFSLAAAVGAVSAAFQKMDQDAQKAASTAFDALGSAGELQQVATSPEDYQKLMGQARGLVRRGVYSEGQKSQAIDLIFAMRNAEYTDEETESITKLGESKQVKSDNLKTVAEALKKYQNIFGKKEAGSIEGIEKKVFAAAGSMQTDFAPAAEATTLFGSEAASLGYSDEEALAAFVAIEGRSKGPEAAATRLRGMLNQIQKQKLGKGSMSQTLKSLTDRVRKGESAIDIMSDTEAAAGLNILASDDGLATFYKQTGIIRGAENSNIINERNFISQDPVMGSAKVLQQEQGATAMTFESQDAARKNLVNAVWSGRTRRAREAGRGTLAAEYVGQYSGGMMVPDDTVIRGEQYGGYQNVQPETAKQIESYLAALDKQTAVLERIEANQRQPTPTPHGPAE